MNVWEKNKRSWRKARKRAVSPIIATILLVAITVVLAAVLYVLISGLTHGPGNAPIGSAFAAGNAVAGNNLGSGAASTCAAGTTTAEASRTPVEKSLRTSGNRRSAACALIRGSRAVITDTPTTA